MIEIYRTEEFSKWLKRLKDAKAKARINIRITRIKQTENFGDSKSVGDGVFEIRIPYGPGYRLYYCKHGQKLILLLIGGDKSSQEKDIEKAKKLRKEYN